MIRFATYEDIDNIMSFIDQYWRKGHILAVNKKFFEYEFCHNDRVNFVISISDNAEINGIEGFIQYSDEVHDVSPVLWMANHRASPATGVQILLYIKKNFNTRIMATSGLSEETLAIYKFLGYHVGYMEHYYRVNNTIKDFKVAKIIEPYNTPENTCQLPIVLYSNFQELKNNFSFEKYHSLNPKFYKDEWYFEKRYFRHPIYQYCVYGIKNDSNFGDVACFVTREVEANGSKVLRIVDFLGDLSALAKISSALDIILFKNNYEYVDIFEAGVEKNILNNSGFTNVRNTQNVIPNYFEPFVQENIDIAYYSTDPEVVIFKADGDQDRPNAE